MPNGTFQLGKIEQTSEGFFDKFYERFFTDIPGKGKLLSVYKFEIDRVLESKKSFIEKSFLKYNNEYSPDVVSNKYIELYKRLINEQK